MTDGTDEKRKRFEAAEVAKVTDSQTWIAQRFKNQQQDQN